MFLSLQIGEMSFRSTCEGDVQRLLMSDSSNSFKLQNLSFMQIKPYEVHYSLRLAYAVSFVFTSVLFTDAKVSRS